MKRSQVAVLLVSVVVPVACCLTLSRAAALTMEGELDEDHSLKSDYVTPHTPWGRNYAGGRVSAFVVVNAGHGGVRYTEPGTRLREVVELMQRFDVDADAVFVSSKGEVYKGKDGEERARRLLDAKKYDVYVFGNTRLESFCPELQYKVLERVAVDGAGLVCTGPLPQKIMTAERAFDRLPDLLHAGVPIAKLSQLAGLAVGEQATSDEQVANRLVHCYRLGEGRGVHVGYRAFVLGPYLDFRYRALTEYDYWMLLVGRVLLWAAKREPTVELDLSRVPNSLSWEGPPTRPFPLLVRNLGDAPSRMQLQLCLRRGDGVRVSLPEVTVDVPARAAASVPVEIPAGRADDYFLDVIALSDRGREAAAAQAVSVVSAVGIEKVEASAPFVERGQEVRITTVLRGALEAGAARIRLQLRDSYGRVLVRREFQPVAGKSDYALALEVGEWATILMRAEAGLFLDGHEVEQAETSFLVPKRRRARFNFVQWGSRNDVLEYYAWRQLAAAGWTVCLGGANDVLAACDISAIPSLSNCGKRTTSRKSRSRIAPQSWRKPTRRCGGMRRDYACKPLYCRRSTTCLERP